jgi:hypothetical protein
MGYRHKMRRSAGPHMIALPNFRLSLRQFIFLNEIHHAVIFFAAQSNPSYLFASNQIFAFCA